MKPVKGMNLDVSADTQPPDTYRIAQNWVYDKEFDALIQEAGTALLTQLVDTHIVGAYSFEDGDLVLFGIPSDANVGGLIQVYSVANNTLTTVVNDATLGFTREQVFDITAYRNAQNERVIVYASKGYPPRIINVDVPQANQPDVALTKLFPDFKQVDITFANRFPGFLPQGQHSFAVRYFYEDKTYTAFTQLCGPFMVRKERGEGIVLRLAGLDTRYYGFQVGIVSAYDNQYESRIVYESLVTSSTASVPVDGTSTVEEVSLEDIFIAPVTYNSAGTVEYHDNRLHVANVAQAEEDDLQTYANQITPTWTLYNGLGDDNDDVMPFERGFQADEVYAFYVSYIRSDGSYSKAYHIPGRKAPSTIDVQVDLSAASFSSSTGTEIRAVDPLASLTTIINATGSGQVNEDHVFDYLKDDQSIYNAISEADMYGGMKYYQTRCTAEAFDTTGEDYCRGQMGIWYNENETYPSNFPDGYQYQWSFNGADAGQVQYTLAGEKIRHHRFPSLAWCKEYAGYDLESGGTQKFGVEFNFIEIPEGYTDAVIYAARRTGNNNVVVTQGPLYFGQLNSYSVMGSGGSDYKYYHSPSITNARCDNTKIKLEGNSITTGIGTSSVIESLFETAGYTNIEENLYLNDGTTQDDFVTQAQNRISVHFNVGHMPSPDLLMQQQQLPEKFHIKPEYLVVMEEGAVTDYNNSTTVLSTTSNRSITAEIRDPDGTNGYEQVDGDSNKNRLMKYNEFAAGNFRVWAPPQLQLRGARGSRYLPAGVTNSQVSWDNRYGAETCIFSFTNLTAVASGYAAGGHVNGGNDGFYSWLSHTDSTLGSNVLGNGYKIDTLYTQNDVRAVARVPVVNFCSHKVDCYSNYDLQDLVAITGPINESTTIAGPTLDQTQVVNRRTAYRVHGDTYESSIRYRLSRPEGWGSGLTDSANGDDTFDASSIESQAVSSLAFNGSIGGDRGNSRALYTIGLTSRIDLTGLRFTGSPQLELGDYERLVEPSLAANGNDLTVINEFQGYNNFRQPVVGLNRVTDIYNFPFRIIRSDKQQSDRVDQYLRRFPALNYYEQTRDRGEIVNLHGYQDKLLIHHERALFVTVGQEKLASTAGEITLGDGDIFRIPPTELVPSEYGYAGTQHLLSCTMTPAGYFFVDESQQRVFLYNGQNVAEISNKGMRNWFRKHLRLRRDWEPTSNTVACHSFYPGLAAEYDPKYNRVVLMIRNNENNSDDNSEYTVPTANDDYTSATQYTDISKYISYSFNNEGWVSLHTYNSDFIIGSTNDLYSIINNTNARIYQHGREDAVVGSYLGKLRKGSFIDISFPAGDTVHWQAFKWLTKSKDVYGTNEGHVRLDDTFEKAMVYNDYQCSGLQGFIKAPYAANNAYKTTLRQVGIDWQWNGFRDLVADRTARFLDPEYNLIESNIDETKEWYDQRRIMGSHAVLRLQTSTSGSNPIYLYQVDAKARKAYR